MVTDLHLQPLMVTSCTLHTGNVRGEAILRFEIELPDPFDFKGCELPDAHWMVDIGSNPILKASRLHGQYQPND